MFRQVGNSGSRLVARAALRAPRALRRWQLAVPPSQLAPDTKGRVMLALGGAAVALVLAGGAAYYATPKTPQDKLKFAANQAKLIAEDTAANVAQDSAYPAEVRTAATKAAAALGKLEPDQLVQKGADIAQLLLADGKGALPDADAIAAEIQKRALELWDYAPLDIKYAGEAFWTSIPAEMKLLAQLLLNAKSLADVKKAYDELNAQALKQGQDWLRQLPLKDEIKKFADDTSKQLLEQVPDAYKEKAKDLLDLVPEDYVEKGKKVLDASADRALDVAEQVRDAALGADSITGAVLKLKKAVTSAALATAGDVAGVAKDAIFASAKDAAVNKASDVADNAGDKVALVALKVAPGSEDYVKDATDAVKNTVTETANDVAAGKKTLKEKAHEIKDEAKDAAAHAADAAKGAATEARGEAKEAAEKAKQGFGEAKETAKEKLHEAKDAAKEKAHEAKDAAKEKASEAKDAAKEKASEAKGAAAGGDDAEQKGAYDPETGEINWDCPCLGGMAHGPCGEEFKEAFSCFVYSETDPKGIDCIKKFENMRSCFKRHPEHYKDELYEDAE